MSEALSIDLDSLPAVGCDYCGSSVDPNEPPEECPALDDGRCSP
jgi:rubrerythrin